jgi:hypothetical protein
LARYFKILSKHNLPYNDKEALMAALAERFNANVYYIFQSYIPLGKRAVKLKTLLADDFFNVEMYVISSLIKDENLPNLFLKRDDYLYRWFKSGKSCRI